MLDSQIDSQQWAENMGLEMPPSTLSTSVAMNLDGGSDIGTIFTCFLHIFSNSYSLENVEPRRIADELVVGKP